MISVVIVEKQRDLREGLKKIIEKSDGIRCLADFSDGRSAFQGVTLLKPDVALLDTDLPHIPGIDLARRLKPHCPGLNIIMLSSQPGEELIVRAFQAGAYGFLSKTVFPSRLLAAIREVVQGGAPMSPSVARSLVSYFNDAQPATFDLSRREKQVLQQLCKGSSYRNMADQLHISPNTVRFHLKNIYKKLNVNSRHEAVVKAMRAGMA